MTARCRQVLLCCWGLRAAVLLLVLDRLSRTDPSGRIRAAQAHRLLARPPLTVGGEGGRWMSVPSCAVHAHLRCADHGEEMTKFQAVSQSVKSTVSGLFGRPGRAVWAVLGALAVVAALAFASIGACRTGSRCSPRPASSPVWRNLRSHISLTVQLKTGGPTRSSVLEVVGDS